MDGKLLFLVLFNVLLFATGSAAVAMFMAVKFRRNIFRWWAYVLTKLGIIATNTILLVRLFPDGEVPPDNYAYGYTAGMFITAVGMAFVAGALARKGGAVTAAHVVEEATP